MVQKILDEERIDAPISCYEDAADLLRAIEAGRTFHILLLDVLMDEMDGIALAAALHAQESTAAIIFISVSTFDQNGPKPIVWAMIRNTAPIAYWMRTNGKIHFIHFAQGILASASPATQAPTVGAKALEMASPN